MKRIKAARICQTLHVLLKEDAERQWAAKQVQPKYLYGNKCVAKEA